MNVVHISDYQHRRDRRAADKTAQPFPNPGIVMVLWIFGMFCPWGSAIAISLWLLKTGIKNDGFNRRP